MLNSSWLPALAGGILIGASAVLLMACQGRIAGVTGMLRGVLSGPWQAQAGRWLFLAGLVAGAALVEALTGQWPQARVAFPGWLLALAGLLVGVGTALARGCTSGHGVCGLARLSLRSLVAVSVFLLVAIVTAVTVRHVWSMA